MLKAKMQDDANKALKSGDQLASTVLRMALATVGAKEKEKRYGLSKKDPNLKDEALTKQSILSEDEEMAVVISEIKKRRDAIALYEQGNRQELADKEKKEIEILQKYLPEQLSKEELTVIIKESIEKTGAKEMKDMGKIMADITPKVKGKADSSDISKLVKEFLLK